MATATASYIIIFYFTGEVSQPQSSLDQRNWTNGGSVFTLKPGFHLRLEHKRKLKRKQLSENELRRQHKHKQNYLNQFEKQFRHDVIRIQCFHWRNITTCGEYPCACITPERYFVFTYCTTNASVSANTRKRKNFDSCACALSYACVKVVFTVK